VTTTVARRGDSVPAPAPTSPSNRRGIERERNSCRVVEAWGRDDLWQDATMTSERLEVQRTIAADPAAIFRVLSDPQGHVTIDSSGMLMDATGDPVTAVGDTFVVHMDREALNDYPLGLYDVTVTITTFVPDREIAWTILGQIRPPMGHVYGYTLAPVDGGTLVTSYYDWSSVDPTWKEAGIFPVISEGALRATLGILARTVARGGGGPST
jgi:polyketide cyclase/dehydrase/lipid transport protein